MKRIFFFFLLVLKLSNSYAQNLKTRGLLQQEFIIKNFIDKQKTPVKLRVDSDMDSLFRVIEHTWKNSASDTLKKYKLNMSVDEFSQLDAYCYLWLLASMTSDLEVGNKYGEYLAVHYMLPAMQKDFVSIRKQPDLDHIRMLHTGTILNSLNIGSNPAYDKSTFLLTYQVYEDFKTLVNELPANDTLVLNHAQKQLKNVRTMYYDFNSRFSFYQGDTEKAFKYLNEGLEKHQYGAIRAIKFSKLLLNKLKEDKEKSFELLNSLSLNTTADHLNQDSLLNLYVKVDPQLGKVRYEQMQKKRSSSAFIRNGKTIQIPQSWKSIAGPIDKDAFKDVKYIFMDFWYTSCGPCIAEFPELNSFYQKFKARKDVLFISINTDYLNGKNEEAYVTKRVQDLKASFPVIYDHDGLTLSKQLNVESYPSKAILNAKGEVIVKTDGSAMTLKSFETMINELK